MDTLIAQARQHTSGKTIAILGGIPYPDQKRRLEEALACTILWSGAEQGKHSARCRRNVRHADLVIALVKLSAHQLVDFAFTTCRGGGPSLIIAPAGLSPRRIAHEIITQLR